MGFVNWLEDDLIDPSMWKSKYKYMPKECQRVVEGPPECLGIGWNERYGWFIMGSGQGPSLLWSEK